MDEWQCLSEACGYGGAGQPKADGTDVAGFSPANIYSCGRQEMPGASGQTWWAQSIGCTDKTVGGLPTNPTAPVVEGAFTLRFARPSWLRLA